jgi:hypothetical protein
VEKTLVVFYYRGVIQGLILMGNMLFCHGVCDSTQNSKMGKLLIHGSYPVYHISCFFHQKPIDCT